MSTTTLAPPAQIKPSAAAELRALPPDILIIKPVVATLIQIRTDPGRTGAPLGPCENIYLARCAQTGYAVLYTIGDDRAVTVHSVRWVNAA